MSADTKQSRMNRALIWTFLWVLWLGGGLQNRMLVPGAPYFWLNLIITLAGVVSSGFTGTVISPSRRTKRAANERRAAWPINREFISKRECLVNAVLWSVTRPCRIWAFCCFFLIDSAETCSGGM